MASLSKSTAPSVSNGITVNLLELVEAFPKYKDPERVRNDVLELSKHCKTLVPKRGSVALDSGRIELLTLHGTFPMVFRGAEYHTPVQIYIVEDYPISAPVCYIVPSPGMSLRLGHNNVDQSGLVSLPYLQGWDSTSNLADLVGSMSAIFGAEPPLFATPKGSAPIATTSLKASDPPLKKGGNVQVLCPSYGRTGTKSMKIALDILGFGPCYHMACVSNHLSVHPKLWLDGFKGRELAVNEIMDGYGSAADFPATMFYREILAANPKAKVVLTLRDPDAWWRSFSTTISRKNPALTTWGITFLEVLVPHVLTFKEMRLYLEPCDMDEEDAKAAYTRHNEEVKAHVGASELLEFSVEQGWEPLCKFLDVPVPDVPFPRVNSTGDFEAGLKRVNRLGWLLLATTLTVAGASVAAASVFGGKRAGCALATTEVVVLAARFRKAFALKPIDWASKEGIKRK